MKRIVLFLITLFCFPVFAQISAVQIILKPGYSFFENVDTGLYQIISPYNQSFYITQVWVQNPLQYSSEFGVIYTDLVTATSLAATLNDYNSVVYNASVEQFHETYNYYLDIALSNITNGNFVSIDSNGLVVTSNVQLNAIFQQFNVNYYELTYPSSNCCLNVYTVGCQFCNTTNLKLALQNLQGTVLNSITNVPYVFLSSVSNDIEKISVVFPNPTTGFFEIQINGQIQDGDLELFDSNGRIVYEGKMNTLENSSKTIDISSLANGVYFLRIKNEELSHTHKIIKK
jgi:hypothetical protein